MTAFLASTIKAWHVDKDWIPCLAYMYDCAHLYVMDSVPGGQPGGLCFGFNSHTFVCLLQAATSSHEK